MKGMTDVKDMTKGWLLPGAERDRQSVTADWQPVGRTLIGGVGIREAQNGAVPLLSGVQPR